MKKTPVFDFLAVDLEKRHGFETLFEFYVKLEDAIFVDVFLHKPADVEAELIEDEVNEREAV